MKRIFWGLVKIALLVGVLVLGARFMMSDDFSKLVEDSPVVEVEELEELDEVEILDEAEVSSEEEIVVEKEVIKVVRNADPVTAQQRTYVNYSEKAGMPEVFEADFVVMGSEPLSAQIARMLGEPVDGWSDLSSHKKTFWVLSELSLRGLNVDSALSVSGAKIEVENGGISVDMSGVSADSSVVLPTAGMSYGGPVTAVAPVAEEAPVVVSKKRRRMSAIDWQTVVEIGQER